METTREFILKNFLKTKGISYDKWKEISKKYPEFRERYITRGNGTGSPFTIREEFYGEFENKLENTKEYKEYENYKELKERYSEGKIIKLKEIGVEVGLSEQQIGKVVKANKKRLLSYIVKTGDARTKAVLTENRGKFIEKLKKTREYKEVNVKNEKRKKKPKDVVTAPSNTICKYIYPENGRFFVGKTNNCLNEEQSVIKLKKMIYNPRNEDELSTIGLTILMAADNEMGVRLEDVVINTSPVKDFFLGKNVGNIKEWYLKGGNGRPFFEDLLRNKIGPYLENKYPHLFVTKEPKTIPWSAISPGYGNRTTRTEEEAIRLTMKELDEIPD